MFVLFSRMLHFTAFWLTYFLYIPLNIAYYSIKGRDTYPINMLHK